MWKKMNECTVDIELYLNSIFSRCIVFCEFSLRRRWKVPLWKFTDVTTLLFIYFLHFGDNSLTFSTSQILLVSLY